MYDVVIIGGGLYGVSTAYHLLMREPGMKIAIVEPDPGYEHAASARSNGGVRILFSQIESIHMSQYGHAFYGDFEQLMAIDGEPGVLDRFRKGYLLMATQAQQVTDLELNLEVQRSAGCHVVTYDSDSLSRRYPALNTDDVLMAVQAPDDMWIDPYSAVSGWMRKVRSMGVTLIRDRITGYDWHERQVKAVTTSAGETLTAPWFVNCTGAWAPELCRMFGFDVPVAPMPMMAFYFETRAEVDDFGVTIDLESAGFRPEGRGFLTLNRRVEQLGEFCWEADPELFMSYNWPRLAHRVPAFESLKLQSTYCCHYALNTFDGNLLVGRWPTSYENLLIATGASGHGLQHAPAAGRGLSELILDGRYTTLDLSRFGCQRVIDNKPDPERGFKA